jgi:carboxyl-terminal processing protease
MNRKPRLSPRLVATAASLLAIIPAALGQDLTAEVKETVLQSMSRIITRNAFVPNVDFTQWDTFLEKQRAAIDEANNHDQFRNAVNAALREFGFSHIVLATPQQAQARRDNSAVGIGVTIQMDDEGIIVLRVVPGAPADRIGLEAGDVIFEAAGKKVTAPTDLMGPAGESVTFKVRKGDGAIKEHTVVREKFSTVRPETLTWPEADTAVLTIPTFDLAYNRERVETLMRDALKAKTLIVDLRNNGGGAVINLTHLMGMLLPENQAIGTFVSKRMVEQYVTEQKGRADDLKGMAEWSQSKLRAMKGKVAPYTGDVVVLVNGGSGSASEIAAAALREVRSAKVIGTRSAGAVLVSVMAPLPHGYQLQYPVTDYVTLTGLRLEGNGVAPDVEVQDPRVVRPGIKDDPLERAIALAREARSGTRPKDGRTADSGGFGNLLAVMRVLSTLLR